MTEHLAGFPDNVVALSAMSPRTTACGRNLAAHHEVPDIEAFPIVSHLGGRRLQYLIMRSSRIRVCALLLAAAVATGARADNFASAQYDARRDQLVVKMIYRGTRPNHTFTIRWGGCHAPSEHGQVPEVAADVLDDHWDDAALHGYRRTVRFTLRDIPCRPALVTLRTAPRFFYTLSIPAAPTN